MPCNLIRRLTLSMWESICPSSLGAQVEKLQPGKCSFPFLQMSNTDKHVLELQANQDLLLKNRLGSVVSSCSGKIRTAQETQTLGNHRGKVRLQLRCEGCFILTGASYWQMCWSLQGKCYSRKAEQFPKQCLEWLQVIPWKRLPCLQSMLALVKHTDTGRSSPGCNPSHLSWAALRPLDLNSGSCLSSTQSEVATQPPATLSLYFILLLFLLKKFF